MITFLGDIALLDNCQKSNYKIYGGGYIANCEYVIGDASQMSPVPNKINLSSKFCYFDKLFGVQPIALSIANNHALDYGEKGLSSTIDCIQSSNISVLGLKPFIQDKLCVLAYSIYCGSLDGRDFVSFSEEKYLKDFTVAKDNGCEDVIVYIHWGVENSAAVSAEQRKLGHWLIENGTSMVVGNHSHCIQPVELYQGKYIFYSLGNTIFPPFSVSSHFDQNGVSHRQYRFKWRKWNNEGLAVRYDEITHSLASISYLKYRNNTLTCINKNYPIEKLLQMGRRKPIFNKIQYTFRKYWLFLCSNIFVDGKIIDVSSIMHEIRK